MCDLSGHMTRTVEATDPPDQPPPHQSHELEVADVVSPNQEPLQEPVQEPIQEPVMSQDIRTWPGPKSLYYLWKAFNWNSNVGGYVCVQPLRRWMMMCGWVLWLVRAGRSIKHVYILCCVYLSWAPTTIQTSPRIRSSVSKSWPKPNQTGPFYTLWQSCSNPDYSMRHRVLKYVRNCGRNQCPGLMCFS